MKLFMLLVLCFSVIIKSASASDISFNWLNSTSNQKSALSGSCESLEDASLLCNLRQISVRKAISSEEAAQSIVEVKTEIEEALKSRSVDNLIEYEFAEICKELPNPEVEVAPKFLEAFSKVCNLRTKETLVDALILTIMVKEQTCKVIEYDIGDYIFDQVNQHKWVSTNKPSGICGAVTVLSLEKNPEHQTLWKFDQVRHYTNTETETCKELDAMNQPISYAWNGRSLIEMNCKYIEFGL